MKRRTSPNINTKEKMKKQDISAELIQTSNNLNFELNKVSFLSKFDYVYNPTIYAQKNYEAYIERYCSTTKKVLFLGMNPGPWGMSQTGVPFGDVETVNEDIRLKINEDISKPVKEHPARLVSGLSCEKIEVSGKRFWGLMKELCVESGIFFSNCLVYNYLPLQYKNGSGKNLTPTILKPKEQEQLFKCCDAALQQVVKLCKVETVVGIGKFAESRSKLALADLIEKQV